MKGVMRFGNRGKFSTHFVGPYKILRRVGEAAYELELPNEFASVHPVLHVYMLKKCVGDPSSIVSLEGLDVKENLSNEEAINVDIAGPLGLLPNHWLSRRVGLVHELACWNFWRAEGPLGNSSSSYHDPGVPLRCNKAYRTPKNSIQAT
ncbi:hypothetical protein MTR67_051703 [Solanum verrucosum]|uniref:Tf2-1-like SH3-like domain-containing protein n=1 Tax=Solanum verrucosum TaxID=315347 RepID=A0AAF0V7W9_SOLVR|nr:hypothetical protein MTR67_051703 [Solanum verrucosum]